MTRASALLVEVQRFATPEDIDLPGVLESSTDVQVERGHFFPAIWKILPSLDVFLLLGNYEMVPWIDGHSQVLTAT